MPDFTLDAQSAFTRQPENIGDLRLSAVEERAIVSIATPNGGEDALAAALQQAYGIALPNVGRSATAAVGHATVLRLARDQMFVLFDAPTTGLPTEIVESALGDTAYLTDQSDSWAGLRIAGTNVHTALERICPLDLQPAGFPPGTVARTMMEHLGVIILCESDDTYLLLSPRSSADDFLHAVETSARNVI